jgi:DNA-binding CsgD family transcriptional regulator
MDTLPQNSLEEVAMPKRRLSMRKIEEVLRLKWGHKLSNRQIAKSCFISHSTVREYLDRARLAGLSWPLDPTLDHATLESRLFPEKPSLPSAQRSMPSMDYLFREMKRRKESPSSFCGTSIDRSTQKGISTASSATAIANG